MAGQRLPPVVTIDHQCAPAPIDRRAPPRVRPPCASDGPAAVRLAGEGAARDVVTRGVTHTP